MIIKNLFTLQNGQTTPYIPLSHRFSFFIDTQIAQAMPNIRRAIARLRFQDSVMYIHARWDGIVNIRTNEKRYTVSKEEGSIIVREI